ncbi:hypothetical protein CMO96_04860 [Candidatus Woesebacteria bacterium]|nr:hypothetical protein [Candidatus Woesebacteria bacterium]|tara:strand:+ start:1517 stop:1990 length:474 start_codon:yes stop_codon:yes gene_type:complete
MKEVKMIKKIAIFVLVAFVFSLAAPTPALAKRKLPRVAPAKVQPAPKRVSAPSVNTRGVGVSVKFRGDRRAIVATFSNLSRASAVSYQLTYKSGGIRQGAGGSLGSLSEDPAVRELLFGTCSHGVCRYHSGITGARFVITTTLTNGRKVVKPFRLRV